VTQDDVCSLSARRAEHGFEDSGSESTPERAWRSIILALRATIGDVSALIGALDDGEWNVPSAAAGWTVKGVRTHMGDLLSVLISAIRGESVGDLGIEQLNDAHVAAKSGWSPSQVAADLERQASIGFPGPPRAYPGGTTRP
jgi:Mycothiol maleylpyruvate isomerase N-terminal domain